MQSKAKTVAEYLDQLPPDRRDAIAAVRATILKNLPKGYEEGMQYGMIGYYVPLSIYPAGYHCGDNQPLPFVCLASQKNYMSFYSMGIYTDPEETARFQQAWKDTGRKLNMGKSCVRFRKIEDVALKVIGQTIKKLTVKKYIKLYEAAIQSETSRKKSTVGKKATKKKTTRTSSKVKKKPMIKKKAGKKKT